MPRVVPSVAVVINVPSHFSPSRPYRTLAQSTAATAGQFIFGLLLPLARWSWNGASHGEASGAMPQVRAGAVAGHWQLLQLGLWHLAHLHCCCQPSCPWVNPWLPWPRAFASGIHGSVSLPGKGENEATASLIWSVIKLVYLHSNMNATEYTAKYHSKPECNCPWSQRKAWTLYTHLYKNV